MQFASIYLIANSQDLGYFIKALALFSKVLNGWYLPWNTRNLITKIDYKIIKRLIKQRLHPVKYGNKFPEYINECFNRYCDDMMVAKLNIHALDQHYSGFFSQFVIKSNEFKLLSLDNVIKLFRNVRTIKSYDSGIVGEAHLARIKDKHDIKLHRITITGSNIDDNVLFKTS